MPKEPVVHKNDAVLPYAYARCGTLSGWFLEDRFAQRWDAVTCKSCLRMAPKAVKARLGAA